MDGERGMKRANRKGAMDRERMEREREEERGQTEKHFSRLYAV